MVVRSNDTFIGLAGCCIGDMSLATVDDDLASLDVPIESIRVVGDSLVIVDAVGALLQYSPSGGLVVIGEGYVAADAAAG